MVPYLLNYSCRAKMLQHFLKNYCSGIFDQFLFEFFTNSEQKVDKYSDVCKITIASSVSEIFFFWLLLFLPHPVYINLPQVLTTNLSHC